KPFDLSQAPLFRAQIVKVSDERHLLLVDMHHIISDGVSVNILIREFAELYNNRKLPALRIQYKDYAVWQEGFKTGDAYKTQGADMISRKIQHRQLALELLQPVRP
ncbi:condensation domain-containing protein, partial [Bacillus subtilis]|uniref:condensation domain-containing protein n=1 Tax=Bacillus subtilis TaxID=1423 RepID=UPI00237C470C